MALTDLCLLDTISASNLLERDIHIDVRRRDSKRTGFNDFTLEPYQAFLGHVSLGQTVQDRSQRVVYGWTGVNFCSSIN
jgi:hypothetical protein